MASLPSFGFFSSLVDIHFPTGSTGVGPPVSYDLTANVAILESEGVTLEGWFGITSGAAPAANAYTGITYPANGQGAASLAMTNIPGGSPIAILAQPYAPDNYSELELLVSVSCWMSFTATPAPGQGVTNTLQFPPDYGSGDYEPPPLYPGDIWNPGPHGASDVTETFFNRNGHWPAYLWAVIGLTVDFTGKHPPDAAFGGYGCGDTLPLPFPLTP